MLFKLFSRDGSAPIAARPAPSRKSRQPGCRSVLAVMIGVCALALSGAVSHAQIGKANFLLLNQGLQLQSMVEYDDIFTLATYSNANFTSINWIYTSSP